jgi:nitrite reductase/ring-hydroxylating ferredoxin subunit
MGPLTGDLSSTGEIHCPWHGYSFDVVSGACTNGGQCRLGRVPQVSQNGDELMLSWGAA